MPNDAPPPPDLRAAIHKHRGTKPTLMEEATIAFEAYLRANAGKLVPVTGAPPPPSLIDAIQQRAKEKN
jgi:hypothetical protein